MPNGNYSSSVRTAPTFFQDNGSLSWTKGMLIYTLFAAVMTVKIALASINTPPQERVEIAYIQKPLLPITEKTKTYETKFPTTSNLKIVGKSNEQCVIYARRITGNQKIKGYAGNLKPEGYEPKVGAIALEKGHVSVIVGVYTDSVLVKEANFIHGYLTQRVVEISQLRGIIY